MLYFFFFFFSSRRRHTRSLCDWSSDVCSSDLEDLGSTNGTMVNGKPVKKHFLQNNDVVEIGKHKLKYFNDAPTAATAADFEKTMIIRNPAKAAPPPVADKSMGDTQTNLKALATEPPKPHPAAPTPPPPPAAHSPTATVTS